MFIRSKVIKSLLYFVRQIPLEKVELNLWSFFQFPQMFSFFMSSFLFYSVVPSVRSQLSRKAEEKRLFRLALKSENIYSTWRRWLFECRLERCIDCSPNLWSTWSLHFVVESTLNEDSWLTNLSRFDIVNHDLTALSRGEGNRRQPPLGVIMNAWGEWT